MAMHKHWEEIWRVRGELEKLYTKVRMPVDDYYEVIISDTIGEANECMRKACKAMLEMVERPR